MPTDEGNLISENRDEMSARQECNIDSLFEVRHIDGLEDKANGDNADRLTATYDRKKESYWRIIVTLKGLIGRNLI